MLTLHRAAFVLPDPAGSAGSSFAASPSAVSSSAASSSIASLFVDGAVVVRGELVEAVGSFGELAAAHPGARVRDWGAAVLTPGLRNPYGHWLLECAYHPDPREEIGAEPVPGGLDASTDDVRCGASARRGLQRMLGFGVTAVAGPFERASVRTAVARSGLAAVATPGADASGAGAPGGGEGPLDPLAVLPLAEAVHGRVAVGGRADFAVFACDGDGPRPLAGGCLATVLGGRLVYRRR